MGSPNAVSAPPPRRARRPDRLALAVDAPAVGRALRPVHRRPLLRLANVRAVLVAAPQVRAGVLELEAGAEPEARPELHPALLVQAVRELDHVPDEVHRLVRIALGDAPGVGVVGEAAPRGRARLAVVLGGRAGRPVEVGEGGADHGRHHAALLGLQLASVGRPVGVAAAASVVAHAQQVSQLVGDDERRGEALLSNEHAAARRVADPGDGGVAGRAANVAPAIIQLVRTVLLQ